MISDFISIKCLLINDYIFKTIIYYFVSSLFSLNNRKYLKNNKNMFMIVLFFFEVV